MISIVMPTYDRAATLPRAIDSVLRQTMTSWELVIVDDGSRDETADVLARYEDPRIRVVRHAANRGVTAAENTGLDAMTGEWFTMLGSDDELLPDALEVLMDTATRTGAEAITCNCADSQTGAMTGLGWEEEGWKRLDELKQTSGEHWGLTKTSLLGDLRFDERLPGYEGVLWNKVTVRAGRRYYLHRALRIYHTEGDQRVTRQARNRTFAEQCRIDRLRAADAAYLEALEVLNPEKRRLVLRQGREAEVLLRSRILQVPGIRGLRRRQFYAFLAGAGGLLALTSALLLRARKAGQ